MTTADSMCIDWLVCLMMCDCGAMHALLAWNADVCRLGLEGLS